ncbi:MAG TPA: TrkA family potassium uptake protein, partial [Nitrospirales bacterium]
MGRVVVQEMLRANMPCVLVERDPARVTLVLEQHTDLLVVEGDATKEHTLSMARIETARGLAACLADDGDNLLLCLTARGLKPNLTIVARAYDEETLDKLRRAGADHTISPNVTGGIRMASTLLRPSVVCFLDVATTGTDIALRLEEAEIPATSPLTGRSLAEARIPQRTGLVVLALRGANSQDSLLYNPGPDVRLKVGDVMIVLGRQDQVARLREYVAGGTFQPE